MYLAYLKIPLSSDLQPILNIRLTLGIRPRPNVISSALSLQSKVLCVRELKGLDYHQPTPSLINSIIKIASKEE